MTKRIISLVLLLLSAAVVVMASPRSVEQAQKIAQQCFQPSKTLSARMAAVRRPVRLAETIRLQDETPAVYAFNRDKGGFVLVSADDRATAVLAYADDGQWDAQQIPDNARWWIDRYVAQMEALASMPIRPSGASEAMESFTPVGPLLTTQWGQWAPFFDLCPLIDEAPCLAGCAPLSAAQIVNYYQYPARGTGSHSYTWNGQTLSADFGATTYDYAHILDKYEAGHYSEEEAKAVATLVYHLGVAAEVEYGIGGTGGYSFNILQALMVYFGYDKDIRSIPADVFGAEKTLQAVQEDLLKGHVAYVRASALSQGGHAFLCDGIDAEGKLHLNWGWSGGADGYYALYAFNVFKDSSLKNSEIAPGMYNDDVTFYTNIHPDEGGKGEPCFMVGELDIISKQKCRKDQPVFLHYTYPCNLSGCDGVFPLGCMLYQDDTVCDIIPLDTISVEGLSTTAIAVRYGMSLGDCPAGNYLLTLGYETNGTYQPVYVSQLEHRFFPMRVTKDSIFLCEEPPFDPANRPVNLRATVNQDTAFIAWDGLDDARWQYIVYQKGRVVIQRYLNRKSDCCVFGSATGTFEWSVRAFDNRGLPISEAVYGEPFTIDPIDYSIKNPHYTIDGDQLHLTWESRAPMFALGFYYYNAANTNPYLVYKAAPEVYTSEHECTFTIPRDSVYYLMIVPADEALTKVLAPAWTSENFRATVSTGVKGLMLSDDPQKYFRKGRLVIVKDGKRYNALGQEVE